MEFADMGSLNDLMKSMSNNPNGRQLFSERITLSLTIQMKAGLRYLHSQNIIHRNTHSDNVLLFSSLHSLQDFVVK